MKINSAFQDFIFDYKTKYYILKGGAGSSKSYSTTQKLIIKALSQPCRILVIRRSGVSLKDSVIQLFLNILNENDIPYTYLVTYREIRLGDSVILFKGLDDPERVKSIAGITDIWIEEATELSPDSFTQLTLRLRENIESLQFTLTFNPIHTSNWVYRFFFDQDSNEYYLDGRDYKIHESTYRDNAFLPRSYIEDLLSLRKSNPMYFSVYAEGDWGTLGKLIFPAGSYKIRHLDIPSTAKLIDGLDLGWNDPNGLACSAVWGNTLYTYATWSASEQTADKLVSVLKHYCKNRLVYGDNAAAAQINEIQKRGYPNLRSNTKPAGSVLADINSLKCYDWYIDPSCTDLIRELSIYQWKKDKDTGLYLEEPERGSGDTHVNVLDGVSATLWKHWAQKSRLLRLSYLRVYNSTVFNPRSTRH